MIVKFAAGHTFEFRGVDPSWGIGGMLVSMRSLHFQTKGYSNLLGILPWLRRRNVAVEVKSKQRIKRTGDMNMSSAGIERIKAVTIAVADQEEALAWYTEKLGLVKKADIPVPGFRWVTVAPEGQEDTEFLLASWFPALVGKNATCVLPTKDCVATHRVLAERSVQFSQEPQAKPYGT
jgi:hypothetical protein